MIKKIRITGFKSIYDQTVELDPVTVLIGRSGTGKSAFVQAIRFLRNYILAPGDAPKIEGGWGKLLTAGISNSTLRYELHFGVQAEDSDYYYMLAFDNRPSNQPFPEQGHLNPAEERLDFGSQTLFHRAIESAPKHKGMRWRWLVAPSVVDPPSPQVSLAINSFPGLEKVVYAYTALSNGIGYYNWPTSVWGQNAQGPSDAQRTINQYLPGFKDDASNYLDTIRVIAQNLQNPQTRKAIFASLRKVNQTVTSVELDSLTHPNKAVVGHMAGSQKTISFDLAQESDGFRRFYAHLLALYQLPPKIANIFEEPGNGIYPGALSLLAEEFKAAPSSGRGQVILTTHSPGLLEHFDVENLRVVEMHDGQTVIGRVAKEQREAVRDNLLTTDELLTVDQARVDQSAPTSETART